MARITWTRSADRNLQTVIEYIDLDNPEAAARLAKKIVSTVEKLKKFPKLGKPVKLNTHSSLRELVIPPCRIFYRLEEKTIVIIAVIRTERNFDF